MSASVPSPPRVVAIGAYRDPLGASASELASAVERVAHVIPLAAGSPFRQSLRVFLQSARAIRDDAAELVHLYDARFAVVAPLLQSRLGVPVTASVTSSDAYACSPWGRINVRAIGGLDHVFVADEAPARALRQRSPWLPVSVVRHAAAPLPWPSKRALGRVTHALRGVRPGRLVIAVPWPENRDDLRWFRDLAQPQLEARPLCLIVGAPNRREVRMLVGAEGLAREFRVVPGRLNADLISAVARCADAFAVPAGCHALDSPAPSALAVALAMGGIPVVTNGAEDARVYAHERNAFVVAPGDDREFVRTLNQVLALPAVQRHALGEEFARYTLNRWRWDDVAETYAERYAALVGRPQIPADLRAA